MARMTLEQIKASRPRADRAKIEATSEEDIARHSVHGAIRLRTGVPKADVLQFS